MWYLLTDDSKQLNNLISQLDINHIQEINWEIYDSDEEISDWITKVFENIQDIEGFILPLTFTYDDHNLEYNHLGLLYALHIRLHYEIPQIVKKPIIILSNLSINNLLKLDNFDSYNNLQNLFYSSGCSLLPYDKDILLQNLSSNYEDIDYNLFINRLNINKKANFGNHDISNAWGCYKLANILGNDVLNQVKENIFIKNHLKQLYSRFLICKNNKPIDYFSVAKKLCFCQGKKILFIDDKSDEGWAIVMKNIFRLAKQFVYIDASKYKNENSGLLYDSEEFIEECKSKAKERWDLVIIDLRLDPKKEDIDSNQINPDDFSGIKLMQYFLNENKGFQILVSTASNKAWNIVEALNKGARGFYIKESPEYPENTSLQYQRFIDQINKCLDKSVLYDLYRENVDIKEKIKQLDIFDKDKSENNKVIEALTTYCDSSFNQINKADSVIDYNYAYISLYNVIEELCKHCCISTNENEGEQKYSRLFGKKFVKKYIKPSSSYARYIMGIKELTPSHYNVIDSLYIYLIKNEDQKERRSTAMGSLIDIRNKFIHPSSNDGGNKDYPIINSIEGYKRLSSEIKFVVNLLCESSSEIKNWEQEEYNVINEIKD